MDFIKAELDKEFSSINFRSQRRNLRVGKQIGTSVKSKDSKRKALLPGKRISKAGNTYYENRTNRSDSKGTKT